MLIVFMYYTPPQFYPHSSFKLLACFFSFRANEKGDPDQMASSKASSLRSGSTVFSQKDKSGISRTKINTYFFIINLLLTYIK